jgi:hypothetical protein
MHTLIFGAILLGDRHRRALPAGLVLSCISAEHPGSEILRPIFSSARPNDVGADHLNTRLKLDPSVNAGSVQPPRAVACRRFHQRH